MPTVHQGSQVIYEAPADAPQQTTCLWVTSTDLPDAAGRYALTPEVRNGWPVWRNARRGACYLYCNIGGGWMFALSQHDMELNRGCITSAMPCGGLYPHEHVEWEGADGVGGWKPLAGVSVGVAPPQLPAALTVVSQAYPEACGVYVAVRESLHNDCPVWEHTGLPGRMFLFSGLNGFWFVGGPEHLVADDGFLSSHRGHGGASPTATELWEAKQPATGLWAPEPTCTVRCQHVHLSPSPAARAAVRSRPILTPSMMAAALHPAAIANGLPLQVRHSRVSSPPPPEAPPMRHAAQVEAAPPQRLPQETSPVFHTGAPVQPHAGKTEAPMLREPQPAHEAEVDVHGIETKLELLEGRSCERERHFRSEMTRLQAEVADEKTARVVLQTERDALDAKCLQLGAELLDLKGEVQGINKTRAADSETSAAAHEKELRALAARHAEEMEEQRKGFAAAMEKALATASQNEGLQAEVGKQLAAVEEERRRADAAAAEAATLKADLAATAAEGKQREADVDALKETVQRLELRVGDEQRCLAKERAAAQARDVEYETLAATCRRLEEQLRSTEKALAEEKALRNDELAKARLAAEHTVKSAADSLLQLVLDSEDSGSESASPPRGAV